MPIHQCGTGIDGDWEVGTISQTFVVPPGSVSLVGRLVFLSDEWPAYFGSQFNDN